MLPETAALKVHVDPKPIPEQNRGSPAGETSNRARSFADSPRGGKH